MHGAWYGYGQNPNSSYPLRDPAVLKYLKAAFKNRWNLLALMGSVGFAIVGQFPLDVAIPLIVALEAAYLAVVCGNAKFQTYVDTLEHQAKRVTVSKRNQMMLQKMQRSLPRELRDRYHQLQQRCRDLQGIAADLKQHSNQGAESLESIQVESLDRLLWIYLRLLFTYHSLQKFLNKTSLQRIHSDIQRIESRLKLVDESDASPHSQKLRRTLKDNLATSQDRAANYERARANHEFVELEIDRLENKIKSLAEIAVNRQEPDYVSSQVDQVASSMLDTERTMNQLQSITGLSTDDEHVPRILDVVDQRNG